MKMDLLNLTSTEDFHQDHDDHIGHDHNHNHSNSVPQISVFQALLEITGQKWLAMGVLLLASTLSGIFPSIMFTYYRKAIRSESKLYQVILATLSSLSGGVLLATTMLHMLPEMREKSVNLSFFEKGFPIAEMLMLYGFCLIYFLEEVAHLLIQCGHSKHGHSHSHGNRQQFVGGDKLGLEEENMIGKFVQGGHDHNGEECPGHLVAETNSDRSIRTSQSMSHHGSIVSLSLQKPNKTTMGALRSLVSLLALSFHAIMEGIAVGVQEDIWMSYGAIASHKCIISLCLGMEMMKANLSKKALLGSILTFSVVSPLGILIGSVLATGEFSQSGFTIIVEGLASGTLLYVIFFEILTTNHDHDHNDNGQDHNHSSKRPIGIVQFLGTFAGILVASILITTTGHSHGHGDNEHDHSH